MLFSNLTDPVSVLAALQVYDNVENINNLPEDFPDTIETVKACIFDRPDLFEKYISQVNEKEGEIFNTKIDDITDIKNASIYDYEHDSDMTGYCLVFLDQDNVLRSVQIWWDEILGQVEYYEKHEDIKKDLIYLINQAYSDIRDNNES